MVVQALVSTLEGRDIVSEVLGRRVPAREGVDGDAPGAAEAVSLEEEGEQDEGEKRRRQMDAEREEMARRRREHEQERRAQRVVAEVRV